MRLQFACSLGRRASRTAPGFFVLTAFAAAGAAAPVFAQADAPATKPAQPPPAPNKPAGTMAAPPALPVPGQPLTLAQAISLALQYQPQAAVSLANRQAAEQRLVQANTRFYPSLTPQYTYSSQYNFGPVTRFTGTNSGTVTTDQGTSNTTRNAELALGYRLFDTGTRALTARQSRQELRASEYGEQNTRQTIVGNVASAYFTALRTATLVKVAEAQVARAKFTEEVVNAQLEVGTGAKKDTYQAAADRQNAEVSLLQARNNASIAQAQLRNALGLPGNGAPLTLADVPVPSADTPTTPALPPGGVATAATNAGNNAAAAIPVDDVTAIRQYSALAYQARPDIAESGQNIEASRTAVSLAKVNSRLLVTSDVSAAYKIDPTRFNRRDSSDRQLNLLFSYPLFDAGNARAQVHANEANERASEAQLDLLRQQIAFEVEQAYRVLSQARAALPASYAALVAARTNAQAAIQSRQEGVGSIVEVITAQTLLVQAETNYVNAIYDFYGADAQLSRSIGQPERIASIGTGPGAPASTVISGGTDLDLGAAPAATTPAPK